MQYTQKSEDGNKGQGQYDKIITKCSYVQFMVNVIFYSSVVQNKDEVRLFFVVTVIEPFINIP